MVALRKESVDRNCELASKTGEFLMSLSARRAWIEILAYPDMIICTNVALRKESVDRNRITLKRPLCCCVALRKESVDRNTEKWPYSDFHNVALRKESVDRNR